MCVYDYKAIIACAAVDSSDINPHPCVIMPSSDGCSASLISASGALFLYLMIMMKLTLIVGDTMAKSCHTQVSIGKHCLLIFKLTEV